MLFVASRWPLTLGCLGYRPLLARQTCHRALQITIMDAHLRNPSLAGFDGLLSD